MNSKTLQHIIVYSITFWLNLVYLITFWAMLFNQNPNILICANNYGEYWFEFFLFNFVFIVLIIFIIRLLVQYWREKI